MPKARLHFFFGKRAKPKTAKILSAGSKKKNYAPFSGLRSVWDAAPKVRQARLELTGFG
jgi:hypothetical protein